MKGPLSSAPDYKAACLWMGFVNMLWIFFAIWAVWGLIAVGMLAYAIHLGITRLAYRNAVRDAANPGNR